jgi:hypothetical protein
MDTRRSFYLAARQDDFAGPAADADWVNATDILSATPANDNSRAKDRLSARSATFLRRLIALHRLSWPN